MQRELTINGRGSVITPPTGGLTKPRSRWRRLASGAAAVSASQAITAGGSLVLQIIAARHLGLAGYGAFALCLSLLSSAVALYTGYVGDALTVLDRRDPLVRRPLAFSAIVALALCFALAFTMVLVLNLGDVRIALIYAVMILLWLVEETGRRVLMARLEFWRLVANDATYMAVTLVALGAMVATGAKLSLGLMLACMAAGATVAIILARLQLPAREYRDLSPTIEGSVAVGQFALWRSLQSTLRPTQLLVARVLILQLGSLAAVGVVEAGRLVVAPIQTVLNGASSFLLSTGAEGARSKGRNHRLNQQASLVLVTMTLVGGGLAALLSHPLGRLMAGRPVSALLILGWTGYMAMWAASLPFTAELTVRKLSWPVFLARSVENVAGLAILGAVLLGGASSSLAPWILSAPALINTWYLRRLAVRTRPVPTPVITPVRRYGWVMVDQVEPPPSRSVAMGR